MSAVTMALGPCHDTGCSGVIVTAEGGPECDVCGQPGEVSR